MHRLILSMQNNVSSEAVKLAFKQNGDFIVTVIENPQEVAERCYGLAATALLMEVTGYTPYKIEERMKIRSEVKRHSPYCKIVLMVDENSMPKVAEDVKQAKRDGLIDQFIYGSTSANYLVALMDAL